MPIRRHVEIRASANPRYPAWEPCFEERLRFQKEETLAGRRQLRELWEEQDGLCPACHQKITTERGWNVHHRRRRVYGGSDGVESLVLLHPNCHGQINSQGIQLKQTASREGCLERIELHDGRRSRTGLRGAGEGDVTSLPDRRGRTWIAAFRQISGDSLAPVGE